MPKHLLLFEPNTGGHHGLFVKHLLEYWRVQGGVDRLDLLVADDFLRTHWELSNSFELAASAGSEEGVAQVHTFPRKHRRRSRAGLIRHDLKMGEILQEKIESLQPTHVLLMYLDHLQLSLGFRLRFKHQVHLGGIYFRPSFHYPDLMGRSVGWKDHVRNLRKKAQLRLALANPHFQTLFCLDPFVAPYIEHFNRRTRIVSLPDGIEELPAPVAGVSRRKIWNIENNRRVALLFGSLAARKGVFNVLAALPLLDPDLQKRLAVVFAGVVSAKEKERFQWHVNEARRRTGVQLVVDERFVADAEVPDMVRNADLVLAAYPRHIGSSNMLVRAAQAGVPVLGSNYGVVGEQIRRRRLGLALDASSPDVLARGLASYLSSGGLDGFDAREASRFAGENTAHQFAETVFSNLCDRE